MKSKIYTYGIAFYTDGTVKASRNYISKEAFSRWANQQFRKDENVTIEEYALNMEHHAQLKVATWHA